MIFAYVCACVCVADASRHAGVRETVSTTHSAETGAQSYGAGRAAVQRTRPRQQWPDRGEYDVVLHASVAVHGRRGARESRTDYYCAVPRCRRSCTRLLATGRRSESENPAVQTSLRRFLQD